MVVLLLTWCVGDVFPLIMQGLFFLNMSNNIIAFNQGQIELWEAGKRGYRIPKKGTVQVVSHNCQSKAKLYSYIYAALSCSCRPFSTQTRLWLRYTLWSMTSLTCHRTHKRFCVKRHCLVLILDHQSQLYLHYTISFISGDLYVSYLHLGWEEEETPPLNYMYEVIILL